MTAVENGGLGTGFLRLFLKDCGNRSFRERRPLSNSKPGEPPCRIASGAVPALAVLVGSESISHKVSWTLLDALTGTWSVAPIFLETVVFKRGQACSPVKPRIKAL